MDFCIWSNSYQLLCFLFCWLTTIWIRGGQVPACKRVQWCCLLVLLQMVFSQLTKNKIVIYQRFVRFSIEKHLHLLYSPLLDIWHFFFIPMFLFYLLFATRCISIHKGIEIRMGLSYDMVT